MGQHGPSEADDASGEDGAVGVANRPDLLNFLFKHKMDVIRDFLKGKSMPCSGTRPRLRERVESYLDDGTVTGEELVDLLDAVEGWGNQHAFLWSAPQKPVQVI